ncbi:MAG: transposase, partial [Sedimenticolaceae bacterium]
YTHRVAIANSRLISLDARGVTFKWKDYGAKGKTKHKTMTLSTGEFMRRFLLHVLPRGFHRIRHYGLIANAGRRDNLARARELLNVPPEVDDAANAGDNPAESVQPTYVCPDCGAPMIIIETFVRGQPIRAPPRLRGAA